MFTSPDIFNLGIVDYGIKICVHLTTSPLENIFLVSSMTCRIELYDKNKKNFQDVATKHLVGCVVLTRYMC